MTSTGVRVGFCKWPTRHQTRYQIDTRLDVPGYWLVNTRVQLQQKDSLSIDWPGTSRWLEKNLTRKGPEQGLAKATAKMIKDNTNIILERAKAKPINIYGIHESCKTIVLFYETRKNNGKIQGRIISRKAIGNPKLNVCAGLFFFANPKWNISQFFIFNDPDNEQIFTPLFENGQRDEWLESYISSYTSTQDSVTSWSNLVEIDPRDELIRERMRQMFTAHMAK